MPLGTEASLDPGHIVPDGDSEPSSPPKKGTAPQFSFTVDCGRTVVCIRIALSTELGLSLSDIVLDEDPAPLS